MLVRNAMLRVGGDPKTLGLFKESRGAQMVNVVKGVVRETLM